MWLHKSDNKYKSVFTPGMDNLERTRDISNVVFLYIKFMCVINGDIFSTSYYEKASTFSVTCFTKTKLPLSFSYDIVDILVWRNGCYVSPTQRVDPPTKRGNQV